MPKKGGRKKEVFATLLTAAAVAATVGGCSSGKEASARSTTEIADTSASTTSTISTGEAVALIAALEQEPLSPEAPARRTVLTAWVVASPDVGPLTVDDAAIRPFQESDHPYSPELFLQYMFGMARGQATAAGASRYEAIESGLRSLLAAYKSITLVDETARSPFLDHLDRIRQQGKLAEYARSVEERR